MNNHVVSLDNVTKAYGTFQLGPVSMEIEPGYIVAVVGPNGSGKSTLFRLLTGLGHADNGEIQLFGQSVDDRIAMKARIGYLPERSTGHDHLSSEALRAFYQQWYPRFDTGYYEAAIDAMGVGWNKPFGKLSKGMQRRVVFSLVMATKPELLLCDELTDGVDPFARREMLADIARFMEHGDRTVVFATHNMDEIRRLADYVVFLVNGSFLGMYEKDALLDDWRRLWLECVPDAGTPGMVRISGERSIEVVSRQWGETVAALKDQGNGVEQTAPMDLTEMLEHLMAHGTAGLPKEETPPVHLRRN